MIDFYQLIANYWGVDRKTAKTRILHFVPFEYQGNPIAQMQPDVMNYIDSDARAELLSHYGVFVGEN